VPSCLRYLKIKTGVVSGPVKAYLVDKFGHLYHFSVTTANDGAALLDLDSAHVPEGLLNPYAGDFDLVVVGRRFQAEGAYYERLRFDVVQTYAVVGPLPTEGSPSTYPTYEFPYVYEPI
jgi:hypothetical protein